METLQLQNELISCIAHFTRLRDMWVSFSDITLTENSKRNNEAKADHYQRCAQRLVDRYNRIEKQEITLKELH